MKLYSSICEKKQSQVVRNHLREDTRNRTGILCMKIKKCFWWSDHQDPMNLYPRMTCTGAMPLITQPQNYTREKMVHCLNRYIMSCFSMVVSGRGCFPCVYSIQYLLCGITLAFLPGSLRWNTASKAVTYSTQSTEDTLISIRK